MRWAVIQPAVAATMERTAFAAVLRFRAVAGNYSPGE
jgi:hypothetical protein